MSQDADLENAHVDVADEPEPNETPDASKGSGAPEPGDAAGPEASEDASADEAAEAEPERPQRAGPGEKLSDEELEAELCALIFAAAEPLSEARLQKLLQRPRMPRVRAALAALGERLSKAGLPLELRAVAGGWQLFTVAEQAPVVGRLVAQKGEERVSPAALETLAVVAYRQPVTKAEIEAIRGVQAGPMLRSLVDRGLVRVTGRAEVPGSPLLYGTTKKFLDSFGLGRIEDLPRDGELVRD